MCLHCGGALDDIDDRYCDACLYAVFMPEWDAERILMAYEEEMMRFEFFGK